MPSKRIGQFELEAWLMVVFTIAIPAVVFIVMVLIGVMAAIGFSSQSSRQARTERNLRRIGLELVEERNRNTTAFVLAEHQTAKEAYRRLHLHRSTVTPFYDSWGHLIEVDIVDGKIVVRSAGNDGKFAPIQSLLQPSSGSDDLVWLEESPSGHSTPSEK